MTESMAPKQDTVLTEEYTCPKCDQAITIPYEQREHNKTFRPKIFCSKCHKDISQPFFINLASNGTDFRKSVTVGKRKQWGPFGEGTPENPIVMPDELVTFDEALKRLPRKERAFMIEYVKDFNGQRAAVVTGYSQKNARAIASRLLTKDNISYVLRCFFHERQISAKKTVEDIERQLERIAFTNITDIISFNQHGFTFIKSSDKIPEEIRPAIENVEFTENMTGISVKVKMRDSLQALKLLGMQKGMFQKDSKKQTDGVPLETYEQRRRRLGLDDMEPAEALHKLFTDWASEEGYKISKISPELEEQEG
jgi:phage terminase small subunit